MLLLIAIYALNYYSRSLLTETQKFFGISESVQHFGNFRKYFSLKISHYTVIPLNEARYLAIGNLIAMYFCLKLLYIDKMVT